MERSETVVAEELDRVISLLTLRIEQQRIHVAESSASSMQAAAATAVLDGMVDGLRQLKSRRAQFA